MLSCFYFTENFFNGIAAEAIACFYLYGSAISSTSHRHSNKLIRDLELGVRSYTQPAFFVNPRIGSEVVKIVNEAIVYHPRIELFEELKVNENITIGPVHEFIRFIFEFLRTGLLDAKAIPFLARCFYVSALNAFGRQIAVVDYKLTTLQNFRSDRQKHVITWFQLIHICFSCPDQLLVNHKGLVWIFKLISDLCNSNDSLSLFKESVQVGLTKFFLSEKCVFVFPCPILKKYLIVVSGDLKAMGATFTIFSQAFELKFDQQLKIDKQFFLKIVKKCCNNISSTSGLNEMMRRLNQCLMTHDNNMEFICSSVEERFTHN